MAWKEVLRSERPGGETAPAAWLVRGGELGEREEIALREGLVIAGWNELGDLSGCSSRESIRHALKLTYPEVADNVISNWTGQLWRVPRQIATADPLLMPPAPRPGRRGAQGGPRPDSSPPTPPPL